VSNTGGTGGNTTDINSTYYLLAGAYNAGTTTGVPPQAGYYLDGWIAEIVLYRTNLSNTDLGTVSSYLQTKWGI
jgi:hypothetical protein